MEVKAVQSLVPASTTLDTYVVSLNASKADLRNAVDLWETRYDKGQVETTPDDIEEVSCEERVCSMTAPGRSVGGFGFMNSSLFVFCRAPLAPWSTPMSSVPSSACDAVLVYDSARMTLCVIVSS